MAVSFSNKLTVFRIPINLIRLEIFFAAFFSFFFSVLIEKISNLTFNFNQGILATFCFILFWLISFLPFFTQSRVRKLSNFTYLLAFSLVLYVVFINKFSIESYYLLIINFGLYCFSLSSIKIFFKLNIILSTLTLIVIILLDFETEIYLPFLVFSYIILGISGFVMTYSRTNYKNRIRERNQYLNMVFNNSSNALMLLKGESLKFIDANKHAYKLLNISKNNIETFDINDIKLGNKFIFREIEKGKSKTFELADQRLLRVEAKKIEQPDDNYYLIEIEEFKDRIELSETFEFDKLKTINDESYDNLFRSNVSLITVVNIEGKIIDINDTYLEFLGYLKSEIVGRKHSILDFRDYSKQRNLIRKKAWEGETQLFEKEIVSKDGTVLFIEVIIRKAKYFGEDVLISNARDISQQKMLEKIADYNQAQYSTLFKESPIGLYVSDLDGDIVETNESFQKLLLYRRDEFLGRNINYFTLTSTSFVEKEIFEKIINGDSSFIEFQKSFVRKDGKVVHTLVKLNVQRDEDNIIAKLLGQIIDISQFIESQNLLKVSETSYREVFDTSFELRYILNEQNNFIDVSQSVIEEYGYNLKEIIGKKPDFLGETRKMNFPEIMEKIRIAWQGIDQDFLWWSKRKDGSVFPKKLHLRKGKYFGKDVLICSGQNIEKDYEFREELVRSEKKYKDLINNILFGILIYKGTKIVFANQKALHILKYRSFEKLVGLNRNKIFNSSEFDILNKRQAAIYAGEEVGLREFQLKDYYGEYIFVESNPTLIEFEGEECVLASFVEITDRKEAEEAAKKLLKHESANDSLREQLEQNRQIQRRLQNSQSYSEGIIESSLDIIFTTDISGNINKMNSAGKKQFLFSKEDFIKKPFEMLLNDKVLADKILEKLTLSNSYSGELELKRKDGSIFPAFLSISHLFNTDGTFLGIMGVSRDISEIVAKEKEIKKQALKLNSIIETSSHFFFTLNKNYRFTSFNKLFYKDIKKNYNFEVELYDEFIRLIEEVQKTNDVEVNFWLPIFEKAFKGESSEFEIERKNIDGTAYFREIYMNPILDENGNIQEISGIGHDITQKKLNELELTNSLKEKEILLKEVHHRVKNNMQVISSILSLQSAYVTDQGVLNVLRESRNRIAAMASIHERLYRTENLSDIKFSTYIKDLAESLVNTYELSNTSVELVFSLDEVFLSLNTAIPCGLILNELISNSLKYAFEGRPAGKIEIKLISESEKISLSLADDGIGIPENIKIDKTDTLGLQLVSTLVEQIEGKLHLEQKNGTKFIISFSTNTEV